MTGEKIKCPGCAEETGADAGVCSLCGTEFEVSSYGYCGKCHKVLEADGGGKCYLCGEKLTDVHPRGKTRGDTGAAQPIQEAGPVAPPAAFVPLPMSNKTISLIGCSYRQQAGMFGVFLGTLMLFFSFAGPYAREIGSMGYAIKEYRNPLGFILAGILTFIVIGSIEYNPLAAARALKIKLGTPGWKYRKENMELTAAYTKRFNDGLRECGFRAVMRGQLFNVKLVSLAVISIASGAIWIYNYQNMSGAISLQIGAYLTLAGTILVMLGTILMIPFSRKHNMIIDQSGIPRYEGVYAQNL